jgi:hypothetical protein
MYDSRYNILTQVYGEYYMSKCDCNDIIGKRCGKLTVVECIGRRKGKLFYKCVCDCGKDHEVYRYHLLKGDIKSCGCDKYGHANVTHGMSNTQIFKVWQGMKRRCTNKNDPCYIKYGARGITICPEWEHDFTAFYNWAVANGYKEGLQIDRIDYNGNYCPQNCRWVDIYKQANNKRNVKKYEINGVYKSIPEWSREYGVNYKLVYQRVHRYGMQIIDALTVPKHHTKKK